MAHDISRAVKLSPLLWGLFLLAFASSSWAQKAVVENDSFSLLIGLQLQTQYQSLFLEDQRDVHTFQVRRARFYFKGQALDSNLEYYLRIEATSGSPNTTERGQLSTPSLLDAYVNYRLREAVQLRVGQFKPYYNWEHRAASSRFQFVDRGITADVFGYSRNLGVMLHGIANEGKIRYNLHIMTPMAVIEPISTMGFYLVGD